MTHTVDTLMALADEYTENKAEEDCAGDPLETMKSRRVLVKALTEALQLVREPLADEQIAELVEYLPENSDEQIQDDPVKFIRDLIRSIERAHGIGGDN